MSDIVERLRETLAGCDVWYQGRIKTSDTLLERFSNERKESADEITRLREENKRLKAALEHLLSDIAKSEHVENWYPSPDKSRFWKSVVNAEKLLKESGDE